MADKLFYAAAHANVGSELMNEVSALQKELGALDSQLNGTPAKNQIGEKNRPTIGDRLFSLNRGITTSTYGPTSTHRQTMELIKKQLNDMNDKLTSGKSKAKSLAQQVKDAGGSWVEGMD